MTSDPPSPDAGTADEDGELEVPLDPDTVLQPWSLWYAVRLMWVGAALSLLVLAVGFLTVDAVKDSIADQLRDEHAFSQHNVDAAYRNLLASSILVSLLGAAMWLIMARANGAGRRWARIFATALAAANVLGFLATFREQGVTTLQLVLSGLNVLLAASVVALLWHPDSSDYYWFKSKRR